MTVTTTVRPPNSLLLIMDRDQGEIPESLDGQLLVANRSCIAIGTLMAADGETVVTMTDEREFDSGIGDLRMVFRGEQNTPAKSLNLYTVEFELVLEFPVSTLKTAIEIRVDELEEPRTIHVTVG
jgi:hypothetical protein